MVGPPLFFSPPHSFRNSKKYMRLEMLAETVCFDFEICSVELHVCVAKFCLDLCPTVGAVACFQMYLASKRFPVIFSVAVLAPVNTGMFLSVSRGRGTATGQGVGRKFD